MKIITLLLLLAVSTATAAGVSGGLPRAEFTKLAVGHPVDNLALREDGRFLAIADETAGTVDIWDVAQARSVTVLHTPDPRFLLWRNNSLYVANYSEGTVSTFSGQTWKADRQFQAGAKHACYLSAAAGPAFDGTFLATCETVGGFSVYAISAAGAPQLCSNLSEGIAIVAPDGHCVVEQVFHPPYTSQLTAYASPAYFSGRKGQKVVLPIRATGPTGMAGGQPLWYAHGKAYFAEQSTGTSFSLLIPDVTCDVTCSLSERMLQPIAHDSQPLGFMQPVLPPALAASVRLGGGFVHELHPNNVTLNKADHFRQSVAATVDGRTYVFVYCSDDRAVYAFDFAAKEIPPAPLRPVQVAQGDLPVGRDAFEKVPVPANSVLSMALSEDGHYLMASQLGQNHVLVWDVATGKLLRALDVPQPVAVLSRKNVLYVCCQGRHAVAAYAMTGDWKLIRDYQSDGGSGQFLSAAAGEAFDGNIIVSSGDSVYRLDTKAGAMTRLYGRPNQIIAVVDAAGRQVIEQVRYLNPPYCQIYPYAAYLAKAVVPAQRDHAGSEGQLFQARAGNPWFNTVGQLFSGVGLEIIGVHGGGDWSAAVPDMAAPHFYSVGNGNVTWRQADPSLRELGSRPAKMPGLPALGDRPRHGDTPVSHWPGSNAYHIPPLAITSGKSVYIFLIDGAAELYRYETDAALAPATDVATTQTPTSGFPARVVEGKPVMARLPAGGPNVTFAVVKGPPSLRIAQDGTVSWTPSKGDVGTLDLKIRVDAGPDVSFQRYQVEVVGADMAAHAGGDLAAVEELGKHYVAGRECYLGLTAARDGIILLDETTLRVLDSDGLGVVRTAQVPAVYHKMIERNGYWLGMGDTFVDVLNSKTFALEKHIPIDCEKLLDIVPHPKKPISYITRSTAGEPLMKGLSTIVELQENTGKPVEVPGVYADRIVIEDSGSRGYVTLGHAFALRLMAKNWKRAAKNQFDSNRDAAVLMYDLDKNWLPLQEAVRDSWGSMGDVRGHCLSLSPDGRLLVGLALLDRDKKSLPALDAGDLGKASAGYPINRVLDFSFHPFLNLVAACGGERLLVCERDSGAVGERRVDLDDGPLNEVYHVLFSPSGGRLLVHCRNSQGRIWVRAFGLNLSPEERQTIALAPRSSTAHGPLPDAPPVAVPSAHVAERDLEALAEATAGPELSSAAIARKFMGSVVVVESREGFGTGFFVGSGGYVLTCAHVLPSVGDASVRFRSRKGNQELSATARVIGADPDDDLALLKIDVAEKVSVVHLFQGKEVFAGEPVTVIGNPGLGHTVLESTLTTGVVSSPDRSIRAHSFVQTSAPVNPGNSGGPMFDSHGDVIGVVVLKANIENTAFAVPPMRIMAFLRQLVSSLK